MESAAAEQSGSLVDLIVTIVTWLLGFLGLVGVIGLAIAGALGLVLLVLYVVGKFSNDTSTATGMFRWWKWLAGISLGLVVLTMVLSAVINTVAAVM